MSDNTEPREAIRLGRAQRDPEDPEAYVAVAAGLLDRYPTHPIALYEMAGALDSAGHEAEAVGFYERALDAGFDDDALPALLLGYGSTLRNLGRLDESLAVLQRAQSLAPDSEALRVFLALTLHAAGRSDAAVGQLMLLAADRIDSAHITRYERSIRGYAGDLVARDAGATRS